MNKGYTDVPVLMVFFNRAEPLKKVFEAVRAAKPSKLFLAQDGARDGNATDAEKVELCRQAVSQIDWDCEVFYNYSDVNLGCGKRMSSAISWAFESVDRLMILEDDCVPGADFFPFCEELLEKYKDNPGVSMISAMNHLEEYHNFNNDSYIFCNSGAIWGWATWKRQWETYDFEMSFVDRLNVFDKIEKSNYPGYFKKDLINQGKDRVKTIKEGRKLSSWTFQFNMIRFLNHQLTIVPAVNMVSNVGLTGDSTHASGTLKQIPKGLRPVFFMPTHKMEFPLKHPECTYCDDCFDKKVWRLMGMPARVAAYRKVEGILRRIIFGGTSELKKMIKKVIK